MAKTGDSAAVRTLLETGANVNETDETGWTALMHAVDNGHKATVLALLKGGADVNYNAAHAGGTALMVAAYRGHIDIIDVLLAGGAKLNFVGDHEFTALSAAAFGGHSNAVQHLIAKGADLKSAYEKALEMAEREGRIEIIEMLIKAMEAKVDPLSEELVKAAMMGNLAQVRTLLARGANPNYRNKEGYVALLFPVDSHRGAEMVRALLDAGANPNVRNDLGHTTFLLAAAQNETSILTLLIGDGKKVEDKDGLLIDLAQFGATDWIKKLISWGANVNAVDPKGISALCYAENERYTETVEWLKQSGAKSINRDSVRLENPLIRAAEHGQLARVRHLIDAGVDVNSESDLGYNALCEALVHQQREIARFLVEHGADPNMNHDPNSPKPPLMLALECNDLPLMRLMLERRAKINIKSYDGRTVLMEAAVAGRTNVVEFLLTNGARPELKDDEGNTALSLAVSRGHDNVVRILRASPKK